ncbi:MAG: amidohydrolase [Cardiobacteriaceae bacterium]|nr:amidohydrolase [Cardiobacteriaceae bacterium]
MIDKALQEKIVQWRRDFHRHPEQGFLEMRTACKVAAELAQLGFALRLGREVMDEAAVMGKPDDATTAAHAEWAAANGADAAYLPHFRDGYTAVVGEWQGTQPGPVTAIRVDMDALPIEESDDDNHLPQRQGFRSTRPGNMHACGHDGHTAIGLGLAHLIAARGKNWRGTLRLIFQPAEEGVRGAKAMVEAGVVDDVDNFAALHLGTGVPARHFVAAASGFLATRKLDIRLQGIPAHAGAAPEAGRNALLAAANIALNLHALPRHSGGASRINVGELHAGSGRNIIADHALLKVETRGATSAINDDLCHRVEAIVAGSAHMYGVEWHMETVGSAIHVQPSPGLAARLAHIAKPSPHFERIIETASGALGSEDATYFMQRVQQRGGEATYCVVGSHLPAGHHHGRFDIDENALIAGADILYRLLLDCNG